ncbi:hypothetical protein ACLKA7_000814 [Drosophila subpalustris]
MMSAEPLLQDLKRIVQGIRKSSKGKLLVALFASIEGDIPAEVVLSMRNILISGDFNAWPTDCGSSRTTPRASILLATFARLNVCLLNIVNNRPDLCQSSDCVLDVSNDANTSADAITEDITGACDASMAMVRKGSNPYRPVAWWNDAIAKARRECQAASRQCQRHRNSPGYESLAQSFRLKRKKFKDAIKLGGAPGAV